MYMAYPQTLAYTVAIDAPGSGAYRTMAKLLAGSLARTRFSGEFIIFRNTHAPIFQVPRTGIVEIELQLPRANDSAEQVEQGWTMKYRVRDLVQEQIAATGASVVLFIDSDSIVLRNIDYLLDGHEWHIQYFAEPGRAIQNNVFNCFLTDAEMGTPHQSTGYPPRHPPGLSTCALGREGINSGTWAVKAPHYHRMMQEWERIDSGPVTRKRQFSEQAAWNRLVLDARANGWRARPFERDAIQCPLLMHPQWQDYTEASLVHCVGGTTEQKLKFMFGLYMSTFYWDDTASFIHLLEA